MARIKIHVHQPWFGGGVGAALAVLLGCLFLLFNLGKGLRDWSFDLPFLTRAEKRLDEVAMVYLDEQSYGDLRQDPAHFDRALHAKLVRRLTQEGARLIVFDILFIDAARPLTPADAELAAAMRESGRVVLAAQYFEDNPLQNLGSNVRPPIDLFRDAAAGWGIGRVHRDSDFSARRILSGTETLPSLGWKAAEIARVGAARTPDRRLDPRWLNYYSRSPFPGVSYSALLNGKPLPPGFSVKDKIVFIGSGEVVGFTGQEKEQFRSPWSWVDGHFPLAVELHAITYCNLARGDWMTRLSIAWQVILVVVLGAAAGYGLSNLRPLSATAAAALIALAVTVVSVMLSNLAHIWWSWLIVVMVQLPVALLWSFLFNSISAYVQARLYQQSLELYLAPQQVKAILQRPDLLKPGASQRTISILFSDIAGFSKISERLDAEDMVRLLNRYYESALSCIHGADGTVMSLIGDAIFAIWNAPQDQADHPARACEAALKLQSELVLFEASNTSLPLNTAVGLHTGTVYVGNIGSSTRFNYTAVGESVNLASRLEGLNRQLGTRILASRDFQKKVEELVVSRMVGHFRFKGFDQVVEVHEIVGLKEAAAVSQEWRQSFAAAMHRFQRKAFEEAETGFRRTLELRPNDGPSLFYLARIEALKRNAPASDWFGEIDLKEK